jgi:phosphoglycolate phosphatase
MPLQAVLFDLDGTLVDSVPGIYDAVNRVLAELKRPQCSEPEVRQWVGNGSRTLMARALDTDDHSAIQIGLTAFERHYAQTLINTSLYPGVLDGLQHLQQAQIAMACVTNKARAFTLPMLNILGLSGFFQVVLGGDDMRQLKPAPAGLLQACASLQVGHTATIMVGDSANDLQAAQAAGIESIAVSWGYPQGESLANYGPSHIVDNFDELTSILIERCD